MGESIEEEEEEIVKRGYGSRASPLGLRHSATQEYLNEAQMSNQFGLNEKHLKGQLGSNEKHSKDQITIMGQVLGGEREKTILGKRVKHS